MLPRRWQNNPVVLGTLAGLLALMEQQAVQGADKPVLHVAPIFEHGSGRGAFGCVAVSPPVFLTEAEARGIIEDESRNAGVEFSERGHKLNGVALPVTDEFAFLDRMDQKAGKKTVKKSQTGDIELNGWSNSLQAGYKFGALDDFKAWEVKGERGCTVSEYDMLDAAKRLQAGLGASKETGAVAVFYEPAGSAPKDLKYPAPAEPKSGKSLTKEETEARGKAARTAGEEYWKNRQKAAKKAGEEDLRMQVRDYIAWLKAQGII